MFKAGDRVKFLMLKTLGTVQGVYADGTCKVKWDSGAVMGPYNDFELSPAHTWQVGDEFEVTLRPSGRTERGKLVSTPTNGGKYEGRTHFGSVWSFDASGPDSFEAIARPILATHTYKPGDKVKCTGKLSPVPCGTVGEYHSTLSGDCHATIWPGVGLISSTDSNWFEPYTPADSTPLSCVRCGEFYPYAEPNLPDGRLACWSCRKYHAYALTTK